MLPLVDLVLFFDYYFLHRNAQRYKKNLCSSRFFAKNRLWLAGMALFVEPCFGMPPQNCATGCGDVRSGRLPRLPGAGSRGHRVAMFRGRARNINNVWEREAGAGESAGAMHACISGMPCVVVFTGGNDVLLGSSAALPGCDAAFPGCNRFTCRPRVLPVARWRCCPDFRCCRPLPVASACSLWSSSHGTHSFFHRT